MSSTYDFFCKIYPVGIRIASLFNPKAKQWVNGRKQIFERMEQAMASNSAPLLWMHCASLGEFEMGRPVLEAYKKQYPAHKILVTFFSPSGYEIRKNYAGADYIFYLPADSKVHAEQFLKIAKPHLAIFVKYEFWHYYLQTLKSLQIPLLLISGVFREDQLFFKPYGDFFKKDLLCFQHFFVQNENSKQLLNRIDFTNVTVSGDTRCDRVLAVSKEWQQIPFIEQFIQHSSTLVAGSTWPEDEAAFLPFVKQNKKIKYIIAPHEIGSQRIQQCLQQFQNAITYSALQKVQGHTDAQTLIIDNIGMLNKLYKYATVTYVGGAWGTKGIHNILEAAVFGKPVLYGPNFSKNYEAQELIDCGGAFSFADAKLLCQQLEKLFSDKVLLEKSSEAAGQYIQQNAGATQMIMAYIEHLAL